MNVATEEVLGRIKVERLRQVMEEGWDEAHDDKHTDGSLGLAAACYAARRDIYLLAEEGDSVTFCKAWPWPCRTPPTYEAALVIAGALIVAELERLRRKRLAQS
jgi:hypothetical protein